MNDSELIRRLRAAGCVFAEEEAALLLDEAVGGRELEAMTARRERGEPLEQVLGWAAFDGLRFVVEPGVFVPRHRSEFLVELAASAGRAGAVVVDLCCGVGALGVAVRTRLGAADLFATDLDPVAVNCARINVGAEGQVFQGDLYAALPRELAGRVELLLANAPYVPSGELRLLPPEARDHEHAVALDGGDDGLAIHRRVIAEAPFWLAPGGRLFIEVTREQATGAASLLHAAGLTSRIETDEIEDDETTVVIGTRPPG